MTATTTTKLDLPRVRYRFDYPFGPEEVVELFRVHYGPMARAFASLGEKEQRDLRAELVELWSSQNVATESGKTLIDAEYLHVIGTRA
ncbi:hypothetical protein BH09MYX1_BH09MYX1_15180 [soil metagenome]